MSAGPFSFPVVAVVVSVLIAWVVARYAMGHIAAPERQRAASQVLDAVTVGVLAARLGYVLRWWPEYFAAPLSIVTIADGGFDWWLGIPVGLLFAWWRARRNVPVLRAALTGMAAGLVAWGAAQAVLHGLERTGSPLPAVALVTPDARSVSLDSFVGKPVVLNLWASWCPPCRREMPVLANADARYPDVHFLLVNQGEDARIALGYLAREQHVFRNVLLDPASRTMQAVGSRGLPTTLFFDAEGRLVDSHMGELSAARLKDTLARHFQLQPAASAP